MARVRVTIRPEGIRPFLVDAAQRSGADVVAPENADAVIWAAPDRAHDLRALLDAHPNIRWVQLPWAGIEPFVAVLDHDHEWTAGQGVYAEPVAEHALTLALAGLRDLKRRALASSWERPHGADRGGLSLLHGQVAIVGAGGIAQHLIALLRPFHCTVTVVRRKGDDVDGAQRTLHALDRASLRTAFVAAAHNADVVVLACALTDDTRKLVDAETLRALGPEAWLVNVARGGLVDTDALVAALNARAIGGAALDVTDPEPLPAGHALYAHPRCIITPHVGNTPEMAVPLLSARITENLRRRIAREPLLGVVDVDAGY